jgi:hypothetical protein
MGWQVQACAAGVEGHLGRSETPPNFSYYVAMCDSLGAVVFEETVNG